MRYENFSDIKRELAYRAGYGSVASAGAQAEAAIERSVNQVLRHIHTKTEHIYLRAHALFKTLTQVDKESTDTEKLSSLSSGGTTATFASAIAESAWLGCDIEFDDEGVLYSIVKITSSTVIEIFPAYAGTSDLSDTGYKVTQGHLKMPDDFATVVTLTHMDEDYILRSMDLLQARRLIANPFQTESSDPTHYSFDTRLELTSPGSTETVKPYRLLLIPMPTSSIHIGMDYYKIPTELSDDSDVPDIPPEHRQTLVEGAWLQIAGTWGNRDSRSTQISQQIFASGLMDMLRRPVQTGVPTQMGSYRSRPSGSGRDWIPVVDIYESQWTVVP